MTSAQIVQKQVDAYNARNLALFVSCFSPTVESYNFKESQPYIKGIDQLESVYSEVFAQSPNLQATIVNRISFDNRVIDHERVTGRKGIDLIEVVVIYEIENGLITRMDYLRKN